MVDDQTGETEVVRFEADSAAEVYQQVAELEKDGDVTAVDKVEPVHALDVDPAGDDLYPDQWGFTSQFADFESAWATPLDGTGVHVAVIDTGVQGDHPDLNNNVVQGKDFIVSDAASNFGRIDGHGHGTHVAGTIAAEDSINTQSVVGGAPGATIIPVRALNCQGSGDTGVVAAAINWAVDSGDADVINLSLGTGLNDTVLEAAINHALTEGVVVVAAAGNNGAAGNGVVYPGAYAGVISVGAFAEESAAAVRFPDYADTPSSTGNSFTFEPFDFVVRVQADDWTPTTEQVIASKYDSTTGTGYEVKLNPDGSFTFSALLQSPTSAIPTSPLTNGSTVWLRVLRQGTSISFSMAPDAATVPTSWPTDLGTSPVVLIGDLTANAGAFAIGDGQTPGRPFQGFVRFAALRKTPTTTPTPALVFDASTPLLGATSWVSTQTTEPWTLHGNAVVAAARASYSNTSSNVAVAAPGSGVISTYSNKVTCPNIPAPPAGYCYLTGTSMATPHVAAVAALLVEHCLGITPAQVRTRIMSGPKAVFGFKPGVGMLRASAALAACI